MGFIPEMVSSNMEKAMENTRKFTGVFFIETPMSSGFPSATFDYRRASRFTIHDGFYIVLSILVDIG